MTSSFSLFKSNSKRSHMVSDCLFCYLGAKCGQKSVEMLQLGTQYCQNELSRPWLQPVLIGSCAVCAAEDKIGTLLGFSPLPLAATATALPAVAQAIEESLALDLQHRCEHVAWGNAAAAQPSKVAAAAGGGEISLHADAAAQWMVDGPPSWSSSAARARGSGTPAPAAATGVAQSLQGNVITFTRPQKVKLSQAGSKCERHLGLGTRARLC